MSVDLTGFDPADSSTWHPMHAAVMSPMHRVARMLDVPLGADMAPAVEHLARTLFQPAAAAESNALDDSAERLGRQLAVTEAHYQRRCELLTERRELLGDEVDRITAENERLRAELADVRRVLDEQCEVNAALSREVGRLRIVETASIGAHALLDDAEEDVERVRALADQWDAEAARVDDYRGDGATETDNRIIDQAVRIHREHAAAIRTAAGLS